MKNNQDKIQFSFLQESTVEDVLINLFHPSKNKLKKFFDKKFLAKLIYSKKVIELPIDFVNDGEINPVYLGPTIKILYEDKNFIVLDKPGNIFVHPLTYNESNNCLSFIRNYNFKLLEINKSEYDRGLLYRLDYETSGVLVYVKNESLYFELRKNFEKIAKEKIYISRVCGKCEAFGLVTNFINSGQVGGSKMKVVSEDSINAKKAELLVLEKTYDAYSDTTLLKIKLLTGHRHQIRIQLSANGYPILGDELYGGRPFRRLCLHAANYKISTSEINLAFESVTPDFI